MNIKKLNEELRNLLEDVDIFEEKHHEIAEELRKGITEDEHYPNWWWKLEVYISNLDDFNQLGTTFTNIILSDIAEAVDEGTDSMNNLEILISKDSIRNEDKEAVINDLKTKFNYSDEAISNIFENGQEDYLTLYYNIVVDEYEDEEENIEYVDEWQILYKDISDEDEYFEEDEESAYERFEEVKPKVRQFIKKTYKVIDGEPEEDWVDVIYQDLD